jgi:hypothetical protein
VADPADAKAYAQPRAEAAGLDWPTYEKQINVESGWRHWSSNGTVLSSPSGSKGLGQLNSKFYPESDWADPYTNLSKSIEIMAGNLKRFGSYRKALAAYNWGPGNVGGYTKPDGTVVPPWDGRRETISDQGRHYLDLILGSAWEEPVSSPAPAPPASGIVYDAYTDPQPSGTFATMPKGIILHGSRSGVAGNPKSKEYAGTASWEVNNPNDLGWNATIGEGRVAVHLTSQQWGWNARAASSLYLGVELAQATVDEPISDEQVAAFVDWVKTHVLPAWPNLPLVFPTHAELDGTAEYGNYHDGKSDVFPKNDARTDALRARIMAGLKGGSVQPPAYAVGPGILAAMAANSDDPATDEVYMKQGDRDEWSEAYGTSGARYVYLFATNRVHRYDPAA